MSKKFGMNQYAVYVVKDYYDEPGKKCSWIGHNRFKCGNCKLGYFDVTDDLIYTDLCPECKYRVIVRFDD